MLKKMQIFKVEVARQGRAFPPGDCWGKGRGSDLLARPKPSRFRHSWSCFSGCHSFRLGGPDSIKSINMSQLGAETATWSRRNDGAQCLRIHM